MGPRFRLGRPTARARAARSEPTEAETLLWKKLQRSQLGGLKFSRQMPILDYRPDFVCRSHKLIVELDGSQHADAVGYDDHRSKRLEAIGFRVLRFWNSDLTQNMDGVLEAILTAATDAEREPTP